MAKILRYTGDLKAFGSTATGTERTVFGSLTQSDILDSNLNADYFRGWGIIGVNDNPSKQDFNALAFTASQLISYTHQMGVPEWDSLQEYPTAGASCTYSGKQWLRGTAWTVGDEPGVSANWYNFIQYASMKNLLIGNFFVNQEAVTGTVVLSAGDYGHDMFKGGSSGCTYTFSTVDNITTVTISAGTLVQIVEARNLAPSNYILSHVGTAQVQINGGGFGDSGSVTATLDGSANATVEYGTGTLSLPQLEQGAIVTPFDRRKYGEELLLCYRHFWKGDGAGDQAYVYGETGSSFYRLDGGYFPVPMRSGTPTMAIVSAGTYENCSATDLVGSSFGFTERGVITASSRFRRTGAVYSADARL
jgi:hypothetical protein